MLHVVRLVDAAALVVCLDWCCALAEECGGGAVALAWLVLAIVSGGCLRMGKCPFPWAISNLEAAALLVL